MAGETERATGAGAAETRRGRRGHRSALAVVAIAAVTLSASCGLGDRQHRADIITGAQRKAIAAGTASGTLTIVATPKRRSTAVQTSLPKAAAALAALASAPTRVDVPVRFDFAKHHNDIALAFPTPPQEGVEPSAPTTSAVFVGDTAFVKRVNRRETERRIWAKLDFNGLQDDERPPDQTGLTPADRVYAVANTVNPQYLVDLAMGTLAGSVELLGTEDVGGVPTRHYRANASLDKASAELDLSDEAVATRRRVFGLVGVRGDVSKAQYWIGLDGRLRRAKFTFDQRLFPRVHNSVDMTLDVGAYAQALEVAAPGTQETVRVDRYGRFVRAALPRASS